jgi:very-short-patch-repair endonuclease
MTPAEIRFWDLVRTIDGYHWRRQHPLGPHVFDFAELGEKLLIEIDGGIHDLPAVQERDAAKDAWAASQGYRVLHIPNVHVFGTGEPALTAVMYALRERRGVAGDGTR